jgi:hypothetical protein
MSWGSYSRAGASHRRRAQRDIRFMQLRSSAPAIVPKLHLATIIRHAEEALENAPLIGSHMKERLLPR